MLLSITTTTGGVRPYERTSGLRAWHVPSRPTGLRALESAQAERRACTREGVQSPRVLDTLRLCDWTPDAHYTGPVQTGADKQGALTAPSHR